MGLYHRIHIVMKWGKNWYPYLTSVFRIASIRISVFSECKTIEVIFSRFRYLFGWTLPYNYGLLKLISDKIMPQGVTDNFVTQVLQTTL